MTKRISLKVFFRDVCFVPPTQTFSIWPVSDHRVSEYNESFIYRLYQMDLDWNDLLDTDPKHYEVTDEQIDLLFS